MIELAQIPDEMRRASLNSFIVSPGTMRGHKATSNGYWYYRQDLLRGKTIKQVFGTDDPRPPKLVIPGGHIPLSSIEGLNTSVWEDFLETSFSTRPEVNILQEIRDLITLNAQKDREHFEKRLKGGKSHFIPGQTLPSLLRAICFTDEFKRENPFVHWDDFFHLFMAQVATEIFYAAEDNFSAPESKELEGLVLMWNAKFPDEPFIPEDFKPESSYPRIQEKKKKDKSSNHPLLRLRNPQGDDSDREDNSYIYRYGEFPFE